jgi:antitoxin component YwqK of YwqJK toxin-antitoxin module
MNEFDGIDELRNSCPSGTTFVGPGDSTGIPASVNGRTEGACMRPEGTRHGPSIIWYADGSKAAEGNYVEGVKDGPWSFWHENHQLSGRGSFLKGKPDGLWVTWHDNGHKESEGSYVDGTQPAVFRRWNREGHDL